VPEPRWNHPASVSVMNTLRMPTAAMDIGGTPGSYARTALVSLLAGAAVFACCFAIGRAERPAAAPAERLPPSVPAASAGTPIPVSLSATPPIGIEVAKVSPPPEKVFTESTAAGSTGTSSVSALPTSVTPAASTTPAPVTKAPVTTTPTSSHRSTPSAGKGGSSNGKPPAKSETNSGTSFDSSG
jgi:hypothetical protein